MPAGGYDSQLLDEAPQQALKSLDRADVVLYAGSFSKVLFPALRLGYIVVPDRLVETFARAASAFHAGNARLEQAVVARFMNEGHFSRHLKRMRGLYRDRRAALADALAVIANRFSLVGEIEAQHVLSFFGSLHRLGHNCRRNP